MPNDSTQLTDGISGGSCAGEENTIEVAVDQSRGPDSIQSAAESPDLLRDAPSSDASEHDLPSTEIIALAGKPEVFETSSHRGIHTSDIHQPPATTDTASIEHPPVHRSHDTSTTIAKADLHYTLSTNLAPKSGVLASQQLPSAAHSDDLLTDSDPEFRNSTPLTRPPPRSTDVIFQYQNSIPSPPQGYYSTYKLDSGIQMPPPQREPKTSARRVKQYTLADGTIVSGKGLGRGRPGIKRGPRNPKYSIVDPKDLTPTPELGGSQSPTAVSATGRKRKRTDSDVSNTNTAYSASTSVTSGSRDSSPEYKPTEETRFGRKTQKPSSGLPEVPSTASPASRRPKLETSNPIASVSPSAAKHHPKIKRRVYRGREQLALCEHCSRGHGPPGNVIVFCDACNKCWHQRCHDPQVSQSIIADTKAEWFCSDCDRILHGKKGKKATLINTSITPATATPTPAFAGPLIGGAALNHSQKQSYLNSLTKDKLVSLVLSASELAPALPLFQAPVPQLPQAKFTSSYTTPVSSNAYQIANTPAEEDEGYDSHFDEHAYLYPKPGYGIKLPPESTDLHMLLESKGSRTFSHWVKGMVGREFSGTADVSNAVVSHAHG